MLWVVLALFSAFFDAMMNIYTKITLNDHENMDEYTAAWVQRAVICVFMLPVMFFIEMPTIGEGFFSALLVAVFLKTLNSILLFKAIKASDVSLSIPIMSFAPAFLLLTSPVILGEVPGFWGFWGIILIVFGAYFINIKKRRDGVLGPIMALFHESGPRLILALALVRSISENFDKIVIQNSSPLFYIMVFNMALVVTLFPFMKRSKRSMRQIRMHGPYLFMCGFFKVASLVLYMTAVTMAIVPYVSAINKMAALFTVVLGVVIFGEKDGKERFFGALLMVAGAVLITLS